MTIYPIRLYGDAVLRRAARPVERFDADLRRFGAALVETMLAGLGHPVTPSDANTAGGLRRGLQPPAKA